MPDAEPIQRVHLATIVHLVREWLEYAHRVCPSLDSAALGELLCAVDDGADIEGLSMWLDRRLRELGDAA